MNSLHPNFPYGKGMWIWYIAPDNQGHAGCEGGNVDAIIKKCKDYDISYVLIKSGDGRNTWAQFNQALVDKFHSNGIKIFSWTFNYGADPLREADIACWALDMGVDGHIFNAETKFEQVPDPAGTAVLMLKRVRDHMAKNNITSLLGHAPFPIIDSHGRFPYKEFGKYCDVVMPQVYYGMFQKTPSESMGWMYDNFSRWEKKMKDSGNADAIKPIIPVAQVYDNPPTNFVVTPQMIKEFSDAAFGYMSVNFYEWAHMPRTECWKAIKDASIKAPNAAPVEEKEDPEDVEFSEEDVKLISQLRVTHPGYAGWPNREMLANFKDGQGADKLPKNESDNETTPETNQPTGEPSDSAAGEPTATPGNDGEANPVIDQVSTTPSEVTPNETQTLPVNTPISIPIPEDGSTTHVEVTKTSEGIQTKVTVGKTHREYFLQFIHFVLRLLRLRKI